MSRAAALNPQPNTRLRDYLELCKPKVVGLMLITALVGMRMASHQPLPWLTVLYSVTGIALAGGAAATINHIIDRRIDGLMRRTQNRPLPNARISEHHALIFACTLAAAGLGVLYYQVNTLAALLTALTVFGYAIFYTAYLKRATPQNIVIGGLAGATPPLLGWVSISGSIDPQALLLVLIIFTWTPAHFWALSIHRAQDYQNADIPMMPVTHGVPYTRTWVLLYTILLFIITLLPYLCSISGLIYLLGAVVLNSIFLIHAVRLQSGRHPQQALKTFVYSNFYLLLLFVLILIDHTIITH